MLKIKQNKSSVFSARQFQLLEESMEDHGLRLRSIKTASVPSKPESSLYEESEEEEEEEEPVTPAGRLFIQPDFYCTTLCILGFKNPIDLDALKQELMNTVVQHKRFSSLMKLNKKGRECWVRTQVNIDDHVVVPEISPSQIQSGNFLEEYAAQLSSQAPALDMNRPLWEVHVLNYETKDAAGVCVLRFHHALGDGISLMSLFLASTRQVDNPQLLPTIPTSRVEPSRVKKKSFLGTAMAFLQQLWRCLVIFWYSVTEIWKFSCMQMWQSDSETVLKGYRGVEKGPSHLSFVDLSLDDMKIVKRVTNATVNDVLLAITSIALRKYLEHHMRIRCSTRPDSSKKSGNILQQLDNLRVRALAMVNTRPSPGLKEVAEMMKDGSKARWGNNMGYLLIPLTLKNFKDPLDHVRKAKAVGDRKKLSLEARITYAGGSKLMDIFGPKTAVELTYKSTLHTTLTISNMIGPFEAVSFARNPLAFIVPTSSCLPQGLMLQMASYMGTLKVALMVKKDIIPDSDFLSQCFRDALHELKKAAACRGENRMDT